MALFELKRSWPGGTGRSGVSGAELSRRLFSDSYVAFRGIRSSSRDSVSPTGMTSIPVRLEIPLRNGQRTPSLTFPNDRPDGADDAIVMYWVSLLSSPKANRMWVDCTTSRQPFVSDCHGNAKRGAVDRQTLLWSPSNMSLRRYVPSSHHDQYLYFGAACLVLIGACLGGLVSKLENGALQYQTVSSDPI